MSQSFLPQMAPVLLEQRFSLNEGLQAQGLVAGSSGLVRVVCGASSGLHPLDKVPVLTLHFCCGLFRVKQWLRHPVDAGSHPRYPRKPGVVLPPLPAVDCDSLYELECKLEVGSWQLQFSEPRRVRVRPMPQHADKLFCKGGLEAILERERLIATERLFAHPEARVFGFAQEREASPHKPSGTVGEERANGFHAAV